MGKGCNNTLPSQISLNNMDDLTGQKVPKNYNSLRQKSTDCYFEQHDRPDVGTRGLSKIEGATVMGGERGTRTSKKVIKPEAKSENPTVDKSDTAETPKCPVGESDPKCNESELKTNC